MNLYRKTTLCWKTTLGILALSLPKMASAGQFTPYPLVADAGSPAEQRLLIKASGAALRDNFRHADPGQFWIYGLAVAPGSRCRLELTLDVDPMTGPPNIVVTGLDNKPLPLQTGTEPNGAFTIQWKTPDRWPLGRPIAVTLGARTLPVSLKSIRFSQTLPDENGDGIPDFIAQQMLQGTPSGSRVTLIRPPAQPCTIVQTSQPLTPALDIQADAIFTETPSATEIVAPLASGGTSARWKDRGYLVFQSRQASGEKESVSRLRDDIQISREGKPFLNGDRPLLSASPAVLAADKMLFDTSSPLNGYCFRLPEYAAGAGYEPAFKAAWDGRYQKPWQDPTSSIDGRYRASTLMADSEANRVKVLLQSLQQARPNTRRMVALHSPFFLAQSNLISPVTQIASSNEVTDVLAEVTVESASMPVRYAGLRRDLTFARAFLEYSSILHAVRGTNKRVWFLSDPQIGSGKAVGPDAVKSYYQTLVAALLFPDVNAYQLVLPPDKLTSGLPPEDITRVHTILALFEEMHSQPGASGNADKFADIGILVSDTLQWQRGGPKSSDLDGLFGIAMPLLQRGIPLQVLAADRVGDPGYLNEFKTLLLSYDYQKPLGMRTQIALADWVRRGGSLIYFGGSDPYNQVTDSWWQTVNLNAPQMDLWKQLGLDLGAPTRQSAPAENANTYTQVLKATSNEQNFSNRRTYPVDLTPFVRQTGSVAVRFAPLSSREGGAYLNAGELVVDGKIAASFVAGSEIESRFISYDNESQFDGRSRYVTGDGSWTYQFSNLPRTAQVTLNLDIANGFLVSAASARPDYGHTLLSTGVNARLNQSYPRMRIGAAYPATLYPLPAGSSGSASSGPASGQPEHAQSSLVPVSLPAQPGADMPNKRAGQGNANNRNTNALSILYTLRSGGAPIWMQNVGRGLVINVGVAPGFFSSNERSAGLLRAIARYAQQRAGGSYSETGSLRLRRGKYIIVRTFAASYSVPGRTIDLLSPDLPVNEDRVVGPNSVALLYDLGETDSPPHVGFVAGRLISKLETSSSSSFFVRGPAGTTGTARLHRGDHRLTGARATDWMGRPVPVHVDEEGGSVLVHYANDPDGVLVRIGWQ